MTEFTRYPPNTFCWPELLTSDVAGAKNFYSALFGWTFEDNPVGENQVYVMVSLRGKSVGAMYARTAEQEKMNIPTNWLPYISVTDVKESFQKASRAGAKGLVEPMDVLDVGKMAVLRDPQGASFALWQPLQHAGAELANEPGAFTWNELYTRDVDASGSFYTNVFGWGANTADMGDMQYTSFMNGERPAAGMLEIQKDWGEVPPHWLTYFAVDDADAAAKKITELGGTVTSGPQDIPEVGRFATALDPQGSAFAIIRLSNPPE